MVWELTMWNSSSPYAIYITKYYINLYQILMINLNYQTDNYHHVMFGLNFPSPTRCVYILLFNVTNAFSSINWISSILILLSKMAHDSLQTRQRLCRISFERHAGKRNENGIISRLLETSSVMSH